MTELEKNSKKYLSLDARRPTVAHWRVHHMRLSPASLYRDYKLQHNISGTIFTGGRPMQKIRERLHALVGIPVDEWDKPATDESVPWEWREIAAEPAPPADADLPTKEEQEQWVMVEKLKEQLVGASPGDYARISSCINRGLSNLHSMKQARSDAEAAFLASPRWAEIMSKINATLVDYPGAARALADVFK